MSFEQCTNAISCARTRRQNLHSNGEVGRTNHVLRVHGHTILEEKRAAEIFDDVGQRSLERLFPGFTEDGLVQATLSAGQSGITAAPALLDALAAATPRVQAMIQGVVLAGLLPKQPLEIRLDAVIERATSTYLSALDDEDQATAKLYVFRRRLRQ